MAYEYHTIDNIHCDDARVHYDKLGMMGDIDSVARMDNFDQLAEEADVHKNTNNIRDGHEAQDVTPTRLGPMAVEHTRRAGAIPRVSGVWVPLLHNTIHTSRFRARKGDAMPLAGGTKPPRSTPYPVVEWGGHQLLTTISLYFTKLQRRPSGSDASEDTTSFRQSQKESNLGSLRLDVVAEREGASKNYVKNLKSKTTMIDLTPTKLQ